MIVLFDSTGFNAYRPVGFGADDMGSVMIEENVVSAAGTTHRATADDFVRAIKALGKTAVQRDTLYRDVRVWS